MGLGNVNVESRLARRSEIKYSFQKMMLGTIVNSFFWGDASK